MSGISLIKEDEWDQILNGFPKDGSDIYFSPEYSLLNSPLEDGAPKCIKFENSEGIAIYPYLERNIPLVLTDGKEMKDVTTPYGYGGPISTIYSPSFVESFNKALDEYFLDMGYVSEFIRFHPVLENHKLRSCEVIYVHDTYGVDFGGKDFTKSLTFWKDSLKRGVKKAEKLNLRFEMNILDERELDDFIKIYTRTMERKKALSFYFFNDQYWDLLLELSKRNMVFIASVFFEEEKIASAIFLSWNGFYLHYHLGGSKSEYLNMRPVNYLFWNVEKWAATNNFHLLHFGGGVERGDGLERFKSSISNKAFKFYVGRKLFRAEIYSKLNANANSLSKEKFNKNFFPAYRSIFR
jgi:hypothetical protein